MKKILARWNLTRILSLAIGLLVAVQSIVAKEWLGLLPALYLLAMGVFAFGCAGSSCSVCENIPANNSESEGRK